MINLDETYLSYLKGQKKFRIDGREEVVVGYGYTCNSHEITGHYVLTEDHKLYYDIEARFIRMENRMATLGKSTRGEDGQQ